MTVYNRIFSSRNGIGYFRLEIVGIEYFRLQIKSIKYFRLKIVASIENEILSSLLDRRQTRSSEIVSLSSQFDGILGF